MTGNQKNLKNYLIGIAKGELSPKLMIDSIANLNLEEIKVFKQELKKEVES